MSVLSSNYVKILINTGLKQIKMSWKSSYEFKSFESIQNRKIDSSLVLENLFKLKSLSKLYEENCWINLN